MFAKSESRAELVRALPSRAKITKCIFFEKLGHYITNCRFSRMCTPLCKEYFYIRQNFPVSINILWGQDIKRDTIKLVRSIYRANKAKDKLVYLEILMNTK
jgi:hypothetical protein